jgi:hypothetical protein
LRRCAKGKVSRPSHCAGRQKFGRTKDRRLKGRGQHGPAPAFRSGIEASKWHLWRAGEAALDQRETNGIDRAGTVSCKIALSILEFAGAQNVMPMERQFTSWHVATVQMLEDGEAI